jgi:hypothetical protein
MRSLSIMLLLLALGACRTPTTSESLRRMYREAESDQLSVNAPAKAQKRVADARRERIDETRRLVEERRVTKPEDAVYAAAILIDSNDVSDLALARDLALDAAEAGDDRGLWLGAEATDRWLMEQGLPQRYATQYVYSPITRTWSLYAWDPRTTDAERTAMGVATLAEALARVNELNGAR